MVAANPCTVSDFEIKTIQGLIIVKAIQYRHHGQRETIGIGDDDLVFFQNGSI